MNLGDGWSNTNLLHNIGLSDKSLAALKSRYIHTDINLKYKG